MQVRVKNNAYLFSLWEKYTHWITYLNRYLDLYSNFSHEVIQLQQYAGSTTSPVSVLQARVIISGIDLSW